jgi:hypothetical protein
VTHLTERLVELRRHLDHLRGLRLRVTGREALERDLSKPLACVAAEEDAFEAASLAGKCFERYTGECEDHSPG